MIALLDPGLFVIHPDVWARERARALAPMVGMAVHAPFLRGYPVRVLWADEFLLGFPWTQPTCPPELRDACIAVHALLEQLRGQGRLLPLDELKNLPSEEPSLDPDLLAEEPGYPSDIRTSWLWLLGAALLGPKEAEAALCVPTWARERLADRRDLHVHFADIRDQLALLVTEAEWRAFLEAHHRPDLRGRRVAVLGGSRPAFERARQRLATYGLTEIRRIPPMYEENRTRQETLSRLQNVELLIVCTNRLTHADTGHLDGDLPCARRFIDRDSENALVEAIVGHFRAPRADESSASVAP